MWVGTCFIKVPTLPSLSFLGLPLLELEGSGSLGGDVEVGSWGRPPARHSGEAILVVSVCFCLLATPSWLVD